MPMTADQARAELARREAAITATGPIDAPLEAVGRTSAAATEAAMRALPEIVTPSVVGGTVGGVAGARLGGKEGARVGSGVGTALGRSVESVMEGGGVTGAITSLPVGFAEGYASEMIGEKAASVWRTAKSRFFRKAGVGELPAEGSLFGKALDDAKELHEWGKFMGRELERDANALRQAGGRPPLTPREIERMKQGVFTPAQLTEGDLLDQAEAMGSASMTGGTMRRFKRTRDRAWTAYADVYKKSLGESVEDPLVLARFMKEKAKAVFDDRGVKISAIYDHVMDAAGDRTIDLLPARSALHETIMDWEARAAVSPDKQKIAPIIKRIKRFTRLNEDPAGNITVESIPLTLRQTQQLRSDWLEVSRTLKDTSSKAKGVTSDAIGEIDKAVDTTLKQASAEMGLTGKNALDKRYKIANFAHRRKKREMDRLQMGAVVDLVDKKKAGVLAVRTMFPPDISTENVSLLRHVLGPEEWPKVRRWYGDELLDRHITSGRVNFNGLYDELTQTGGGRLAQTKEVLGDDYYNTLRRFAEVGRQASKPNPAGSKVAINIAETGAVLSAAGGGAGLLGEQSGKIGILGSAAIFVPMAVLNRWLANPRSAELVLTGMKGKGGMGLSRELSALVARTIAEEGADSAIKMLPKSESLEEMRARKGGNRQPANYAE